MSKPISRREFLRFAGLASVSSVLAACAPQVIEKTVEVKQTVEVPVEKTVQVKQTVEVPVEKTVVVQAPTATAPPPPEAVTLRFYTTQWASTKDARPQRQIAFRSVLDSFNSNYAGKGWSVEEVIFDGEDTTLTQEIEAGNVDAMWFDFGTYGNRKRAGHLLDLTDVLPNGAKDFFPWVEKTALSIDGKIGALWHNTDTPLHYYNTEKIPNPPQTWSGLADLCKQVRTKEGGKKYAWSPYFVGMSQTHSGMFLALGGQFVDDQGAPLAFNDKGKEVWTRIFTFYADLLKNKLVPEACVGWGQGGDMPEVFAGNFYSTYMNSNFHMRELQPTLPPEEYDKWFAQILPHPDEVDHGLYQAGGWMIGAVPKGNQKAKEAAKAFVVHATNPQAMAQTTKAGGWIPTRPAVIQTDPFFKDDKYTQVTLKGLEYGEVIPLWPIYFPIWNAIEPALQSALLGKATIAQAIDNAEAETMKEWEALK